MLYNVFFGYITCYTGKNPVNCMFGKNPVNCTIVCLGTSHWLFSPACDAVELTLKVGFNFRGHRPSLFRSKNGVCFSRTYACPSSTYPRRRIPSILPMVIKLAGLSGGFQIIQQIIFVFDYKV